MLLKNIILIAFHPPTNFFSFEIIVHKNHKLRVTTQFLFDLNLIKLKCDRKTAAKVFILFFPQKPFELIIFYASRQSKRRKKG
jgi:hypothetical protein